MKVQAHAQNKRTKGMITVFMLMILTYLLFHLFFSERSVPTLLSLNIQHEALQMQMASLQAEKAKTLDRVIRLRPETLDPDLVEELAIQLLGHSPHGGMIVVDG